MRIGSVKIGAYTIPVKWEANQRLEDESRWAEFDYRGPCISVATIDRSEPAKAEALLHEILHGLFWDSGLRADKSWDKDHEEQMVEAISPRLAAFIRDNPDVLRELMKALK